MINKISLDLTKNIPTRQALIFGMENENNSSSLEIKLPYSLIDKWLYIEFSTSECEPFTTPRLTAQDIDGNAILVYEIGNSITQYLGFGKMQVIAKNASGLVWKSSEVDYIIKNSINATEQIVENKPDVIADLQRQINEIGGGGGSTPSGSNSSGIYVVTQDLALEGTSSTPLDSVLVGEKELQVGDILTDNKGTIAKVSSIEESSGGSVDESTIVVANYEVVSNQEIPQDLLNKIDNALSTAQGKIKGISYYDLTAMVIDLLSYDNQKLKVPDIIKLKQTNVPDYWVSEVYDTYHDYTYISDEQTMLDISNGIPIGYYALDESETKTVEVSNNYTDLENKPNLNGVEIVGNMTSSQLKLGMQTASGGFQGGSGASTNWGGSVGKGSTSSAGGSVGNTANCSNGGAIGENSNAYNGFAGGQGAQARYDKNGRQIEKAVAIGWNAKARAENAVQLGTGINDEENTMKVGDYKLLDADGKIPIERLPEEIINSGNSLTPFAVGDTINAIKFDTAKETELLAFLQSLQYPEGVSLMEYNDGVNDLPVLIALYVNGIYMLAGESTIIYASADFDLGDGVVGVQGFQNQVEAGVYDGVYNIGKDITISKIEYSSSWNGKLAGKVDEINTNKGDENAFTSLASGQSIEKIVFNPNVSIEKMTNYLSGLTYDETIQGVPSVCELLSIDRGGDTIKVYAIDFSALNVIVPNTSGYGIAVIDTTADSGGFVLKQAVFATEYNEANVTLINAIKDANYTLDYTKAGWSDTNDYVLDTSTTHTIYSVHDNKVSAFIGRDSRFFDVIEMLDNDTELKEFTVEKTINTVQNARLIISVINNAKCIKSIGMKTYPTDNYTSCFISNSADTANEKTITLSKISYKASNSSIAIWHYLFGENNGSLRTFYNTMTINSSGNTFTNIGDTLYVKITYYNDVEITA